MTVQLPAEPATRISSSTTTEFAVRGMTCSNCARHVTEAIQSVPGVQYAVVSLEANRAAVSWREGATVDRPAVVAAIQNAGYGATPLEPHAHGDEHGGQSNWHLNLWLGGIVTVALMVGEWIFDWAMHPTFQWFAFAAASLVQVLAGAQFYRGAWRQLKIGSSNMDTLVALGSTTAFTYSAWALLTKQGGHVYFMEAAAIITLISVGHWVEARVSAKASGALKSLLQLAPQTARRIAAPSAPKTDFSLLNAKFTAVSPTQTVETEVPVSELRPGDLVALRPGDRVPVDGVVTEGESAVDEAMLTGESIPADKKSGSELYAGTVNLNGRLVMRITATGEATALAHIIAAVQRAQTSRANIQRIGDRVSDVFVPIVVAVALAAALWWGLAPASAQRVHEVLANFLWHAHPPAGAAAAFIIAAAVLIIACPCAMGLATPAAIMASANAAAARGILIRDGVALEKAGEVTAVIFDKTGTLTPGQPKVAKIWKADGATENVEAMAATLAGNSTHPISRAISGISPNKIELREWNEVRGAGVEAKMGEGSGIEVSVRRVRLGSLRWLRESGVDLTAAEKFVSEWSAQGATIVGLSFDDTLIAMIALRDSLKRGAAGVVAKLQREGLKTFLLTGDNALTAAAIAQEAGIPSGNVFAEVRPEQKAEFVKQLQLRGERVAFVGDGINDAPALTQADLGIAVGRASDVAREAADIILLKSEIEAVPEALGLARATLRTIKQNLFWAFFYNALGVPLAALGFMSPVLCAAAMGVSDLVVIGNALRLRWWRG